MKVNWKIDHPELAYSSSTGIDEVGNVYHMTANQEIVTVKTHDGLEGMGWTAEKAYEQAESKRDTADEEEAKLLQLIQIGKEKVMTQEAKEKAEREAAEAELKAAQRKYVLESIRALGLPDFVAEHASTDDRLYTVHISIPGLAPIATDLTPSDNPIFRIYSYWNIGSGEVQMSVERCEDIAVALYKAQQIGDTYAAANARMEEAAKREANNYARENAGDETVTIEDI